MRGRAPESPNSKCELNPFTTAYSPRLLKLKPVSPCNSHSVKRVCNSPVLRNLSPRFREGREQPIAFPSPKYQMNREQSPRQPTAGKAAAKLPVLKHPEYSEMTRFVQKYRKIPRLCDPKSPSRLRVASPHPPRQHKYINLLHSPPKDLTFSGPVNSPYY